MLASVSSAFASPLTCPKPQDIRSSGSIFTHAFVVEGYNWALISNPFTFDNHEWQTTFKVYLPSVISSKDAVVLGSKEFDSTPLWNEPNADTLGNKTICTYIAMQDGVMVTAISPADWGFKKR
ncbi:MAG TPA: hypothetical protein VL360_06980 [Gammaproteobacteria bacterium]|nr:hypothetical protein [Gammaproteobacteria bacterium]